MPPVIDKTKCVGCGTCASICPMRVFVFQKEKNPIPEIRFGEECWHCILCELECRQKAIKVRLPMPMELPYIDAATLHNK